VAAGITDLEVQTQAQMSNPSWVTKEQLAAIEHLLDDWPEYVEPDREITISSRGAGFDDPIRNQAVEEAATDAVIDYYVGWRAKDVSRDKCGWDITFTHRKTGQIARVEVKGVSGDHPTVALTDNEIRAAKIEDGWHLAVVLRALSEPKVVEYSPQEVLQAANSYVYRAKLPPR
jgi:hypothetical protein